eukprot:Gb_08514 [translate_table: standard]
MVDGGGASIIYADTVGDLGYVNELGNYVEYSGALNEDEYAIGNPDGLKRALVIGGGIANFTDVAATLVALFELYGKRGGPNYQNGLAKMRALGEEIGVPFEV